jgi:hypothetical protein
VAFVRSLLGISQTVEVFFLFHIVHDFSIVFLKVVVHQIARYAFGYENNRRFNNGLDLIVNLVCFVLIQ